MQSNHTAPVEIVKPRYVSLAPVRISFLRADIVFRRDKMIREKTSPFLQFFFQGSHILENYFRRVAECLDREKLFDHLGANLSMRDSRGKYSNINCAPFRNRRWYFTADFIILKYLDRCVTKKPNEIGRSRNERKKNKKIEGMEGDTY